jgi:preprotein translocase subunit SecY
MKMMLVCYQILSCGGLSFMWIGVSGSSPKEEAKKMQAQGMCLAGARATAKHQVRPTVSAENILCF